MDVTELQKQNSLTSPPIKKHATSCEIQDMQSPANFPLDVSSIITSTPVQVEHYLQKKTAATPVAQLPINNCRHGTFQ